MLILEITSSAVITSVPAEAQGRSITPDRGHSSVCKNCMGRTKLRGELGLIRLRGTGSPIRLAVSRCQLLTVSCPFIQDRLQGFRNFCSLLKRDHFTLCPGCILSFCASEDYVEEAWPIVDPVLKADTQSNTQSMNMGRTRGERAKSIKKSRTPSRIPS
jgi:hypothetical protein